MPSRRIEDLPVYEATEAALDPRVYNHVRLALLRLGSPLRIPLTGLRDMDMLIERDRWVCVDRSMADLPVAAWLDFVRRDSLHTRIVCRRLHFHCHADVIVDRVVSILDGELADRLSKSDPRP